MEHYDIMSIYDRLCAALTAYESEDADPDYDDKSLALYFDLVDIVNDFASKLN